MKKHPLPAGLFVHIFEDGKIEHQGVILGVTDGVAYVQLFAWTFGEPSSVIAVPLTKLHSKECALYASNEQMKYAYGRHMTKPVSKEEGRAIFKALRESLDA